MELKKSHRTVASLVLGIACIALPSTARAVTPARLAGAVAGLVTDHSGTPQMGAAVYLFNKQDRFFEKVLTNERGEFRFAGLFPDLYSVRVSLASFVPAIKNNVLVQAGLESVLHVSLNSLFSSIQVVYSPADTRGFMSDDWKWVLRTASSTRPVLRLLPDLNPNSDRARTALFSDTRGVFKVSAGEGGSTGTASTADLGTAFALATSLFGNHSLQVAGNLGYGAATGAPTAGFRTSIRGKGEGSGQPELSVTMRQLSLPGRLSNSITSGENANLPALRTMTVSFDDRTRLSDSLEMQYGFSLDSVTFLDQLNYFSPYARLVYTPETGGTIEFAFTSGNARPELGAGPSSAAEPELQGDINSLALFPRVSLRGRRARVQRGNEFELAYARRLGSRSVRFAAYHEEVDNAALTVAGAGSFYSSGDILPDLFTEASIFNAGSYQSTGLTASLTQDLGEHVSATFTYGSMGALTARATELVSTDPDDLRAMIRAGRRHSATARLAATNPRTGTHMVASYQWTDTRWLAPGHLYSTSARPEPGLNLYIRQPIPSGFLPWRMEATADLRNLLAQGYLPIDVAGQHLTLVQTPRSFRGGLSFIF